MGECLQRPALSGTGNLDLLRKEGNLAGSRPSPKRCLVGTCPGGTAPFGWVIDPLSSPAGRSGLHPNGPVEAGHPPAARPPHVQRRNGGTLQARPRRAQATAGQVPRCEKTMVTCQRRGAAASRSPPRRTRPRAVHSSVDASLSQGRVHTGRRTAHEANTFSDEPQAGRDRACEQGLNCAWLSPRRRPPAGVACAAWLRGGPR